MDGCFRPATKLREASGRVAAKVRLPSDRLNDDVKGFVSERGKFDAFLEPLNLRVLLALPEYLLAMKCLAFRIGSEFHDEDDVRYLLRHLDVRTQEAAPQIITRYYPLERFPKKTRHAMAELLPQRD